MQLLGLDSLTLIWIALASLLAFFVRGLSGFGSSMIGIGGLSMVLPPRLGVPAFMALELLTSVTLLPGIWRQVEWKSLRWVMVGCALTTPLGLLLLAGLDPNPMRLVVSVCLLSIALFMLSGAAERFAPKQVPGPVGAMTAGAASGVLSGAAGIGGPPAIVFYFSTVQASVGRATMIAYLVFTDIYALAWAAGTGVLSLDGWPLIVVALPFALLGIALGKRLYARLNEQRLRRVIWALLVALGLLGTFAALWSLLRA